MQQVPAIVWLLLASGLVFLSVHGLRGWLEIREALRLAELDRLASPADWPACRALAGAVAALPVVWFAREIGVVALLAGFAIMALGYWMAPKFLEAAKHRVQQQVLDELGPHLDLLAVAMESGSSWTAALVLCTERAADGPLRRAWQRVLLEIHAGAEPLDALRSLEQRLRLPALSTLVSALRAAEKLKLPPGAVLRDRARHCAASRFARAERRARAAPLKLYAAMWLCLLPCTAFVLAFPLARLLARWAGQA
jgi:tight adherence protein C